MPYSVLLAALILLVFAVGAPGHDQKRRITVVGDVAYAPFEFVDENGKVSGISVDLWKLWSQKTGIEVDYRLYDWSKAIDMVRKGRADAIGGIFFREDPSLNFSEPYLQLNSSIVYSADIKGIKDIADIKGFEVGVVRGDYMEGYLKEKAPGIPLVLAANYAELVDMAISGRVKVFVCEDPVAKFLLTKQDALRQFKFAKPSLRVDLLRAGVNADNQALLRLVNMGFARISNEEKLEIVLRWTGRGVISPFQWKLFAASLLVVLAVLATVVLWNRQLRHNIAKATKGLKDKQEEFEAIFKAMPDMFFLMDDQGRYLEFRGGSESQPLVPPDRFLGKTMHEVLPEETAERFSVAMDLAGQRREVVHLEYELVLEGMRRTYELRVAPLGENLFVSLVRDISARKSSEQRQVMAAKVIENAIEGIMVADSDGVVLMANPACKAITGYENSELVGSHLDVLRADNKSLDIQEKILANLAENGQWAGEHWNRRKNGEAYPEWLALTIIRDSQGRPINYLAIFYDITEIKQSIGQVEYQAHHDALTGLPNRTLLKDRLEHVIQQVRRQGGKVAVLFIDLDNFKDVNDTHGHAFGDVVLKQAANRLRDCLRDQDTVARFGGDEFVMVIEAVGSGSDAVQVCRRILSHLNSPMIVQGQTIQVRVSIGVAMYPDDGEDADLLIKNADMAMYRAKEKGKNNYQMFTPALQSAIQRRITLESALRHAMHDEQFAIEYQPRFDIASGRPVGFEALLRWDHPEKGRLYPGGFLQLAEETGLIIPMGDWVLGEACRQARNWLMVNPDLRLSVNLSNLQLRDASLAETVGRVLAESELPPEMLELEFMEAATLLEEREVVKMLRSIAEFGVRLSFDNYGTGMCSIKATGELPLSQINFSPIYTQELGHGQRAQAIVRGIIAFGHEMDLKVLAKGVETQRQLDQLRQMGCDLAQGYFLGRPVPAPQLEELILPGD